MYKYDLIRGAESDTNAKKGDYKNNYCPQCGHKLIQDEEQQTEDCKQRNIIEKVANYYGMSGHAMLKNNSRAWKVVVPRHIAMYLLSHILGIRYKDIAIFFKRDRATALHAIKSIAGRLEVDKAFRTEVEWIIHHL